MSCNPVYLIHKLGWWLLFLSLITIVVEPFLCRGDITRAENQPYYYVSHTWQAAWQKFPLKVTEGCWTSGHAKGQA